MKRRAWSRLCRYAKCRLPFTDDSKFVYCSAACGRLARGRDIHGRIVRFWRPEYRRAS